MLAEFRLCFYPQGMQFAASYLLDIEDRHKFAHAPTLQMPLEQRYSALTSYCILLPIFVVRARAWPLFSLQTMLSLFRCWTCSTRSKHRESRASLRTKFAWRMRYGPIYEDFFWFMLFLGGGRAHLPALQARPRQRAHRNHKSRHRKGRPRC